MRETLNALQYFCCYRLQFSENEYNLSKFYNFIELQVDAERADGSENDKNSESNVVKNDASDDEKGKL